MASQPNRTGRNASVRKESDAIPYVVSLERNHAEPTDGYDNRWHRNHGKNRKPIQILIPIIRLESNTDHCRDECDEEKDRQAK